MPSFRRRLLCLSGAMLLRAVCALGVFATPHTLLAQIPVGAERDSLATLRIQVRHGAVPVEGVVVRSERVGASTDATGSAMLRLPAGAHEIVSARLGFVPDTARVTVRGGLDTLILVQLKAQHAEMETMVVSATRAERRVEDTPIRVEVIDEEEIAEKVAMTPGDIAMMLNETSGLRVQATNPSLGGANVRIQGLRGRYSLLLADGLPLYGGQTGGLGLLQIPPVDLGRVEIIKGTASALYGSSALGGVVNLVSRRPTDTRENTLLLNQTSRGGTDGVAFLAGPMTDRWGYTLLAGAHRQTQNDLDDDGWTDMPGYRRAVVRPRFFYGDRRSRSAFLTGGLTLEEREGGTLPGRTLRNGTAYEESLRTERADIGGLAQWILGAGDISGDTSAETSNDTDAREGSARHDAILSVRGSAVEQRHTHRFGANTEDDRHRTWFGEASIAVPRGPLTYVVGAALQQDAYRNRSVAGFDYTFTIPAVFVQTDVDAASWLSLSTSARMDAHNVYGTFVNPRVSVLLRRPSEGAFASWTSRLSGGTGAFAPTPFTEETEATGLRMLDPLEGLVAERARSVSLDIGGPLETAIGQLEVNATAFGSRIMDAVQLGGVLSPGPGMSRRVMLVNAAAPTRTWGGELLARLVHELGGGHDEEAEGADDEHEAPALRITASYTYLRSTECDPEGAPPVHAVCARREVPLTPRHSAGVVASIEQEGKSRVGLELYYTGRQRLEQNPYRNESKPYLVIGVLAERAFATRMGIARLFVNLENIGNVRQTRVDPLVLPIQGQGGRWTTDVWSLLEGRTINGGVRWTF